MKKWIIAAALLALLLTGCGKSEPAATAAPETTSPATEAPTTEPTLPPVNVAERLEEAKLLFYGSADQMPDRAAATELLEELSDQDDPELFYLLALDAYRRGNSEKALLWCEKAVDRDYDLARLLLGQMYKNGTAATPRDLEKAEALFREAVDNGCADGHNGLGDIYQMGYCGKVDLIKAAEEFTIAAEDGIDPYWIGYAYLSLGAVNRTRYVHFEEDYCDYEAYVREKPDYEAAVSYYEKAAELWNCQSMNSLINAYLNGVDLGYLKYYSPADDIEEVEVEPNPELAQEWAQKLIVYAEQAGDPEACKLAGDLFAAGRAVEQDYDMALQWYQQGADMGDGECMNQIGVFYYYAYSVEKDPEQEIAWFRKSAETGCVHAMVNIAESYAAGDSLEQDDEKAIEWYERAAASGDSSIMGTLGNFYYYHCGDQEKGMEYYEKAAELGNSSAMYAIGNIYNNRGEYEKAAEWYLKGVLMQNTKCMVSLCRLYNSQGMGTIAEQASLAEMAWKLKDPEGMLAIGESFEVQAFYSMDRNRAITFYKLAADYGDQTAMEYLKRLGITYTPANGT